MDKPFGMLAVGDEFLWRIDEEVVLIVVTGDAVNVDGELSRVAVRYRFGGRLRNGFVVGEADTLVRLEGTIDTPPVRAIV